MPDFRQRAGVLRSGAAQLLTRNCRRTRLCAGVACERSQRRDDARALGRSLKMSDKIRHRCQLLSATWDQELEEAEALDQSGRWHPGLLSLPCFLRISPADRGPRTSIEFGKSDR